MLTPLPLQSRRQFLGSAAAAIATAGIASHSTAAETKPSTAKSRNPFTYRFNIGEFEAYSISDGHGMFRPGVSLMWPEADRPAMQEDLVRHGERTDGLPLYVNVLLVRMGNEIAIFDSGFGRGTNPNTGWLMDALAAIEVDPAKVTQSFLSHAHSDHIGGFVAANKAVFPNAAFHCLKEEVAFWRSPSPDFSHSKRAKGPLPGMIKDARAKFDVLQPSMELHRDGDEV